MISLFLYGGKPGCKKKRFQLFKRHLKQNWWAENMPLLALRLVLDVHCCLERPFLRFFHEQLGLSWPSVNCIEASVQVVF